MTHRPVLSRPLRFLARGMACAVLALLLAAPAFAGDDQPDDPLVRLTDAERARLERSAAWDDLSVERKREIAAAVLRMRDLTPAERKRLTERIERYQAARRRSREAGEDLPERLRRWRGEDRKHHRHHRRLHALARGAAQAALERLGPERRRALRAWKVTRGAEIAFYRMLLEAAAKPYAEGARPFDLSHLRDDVRARVEARLEDAGPRARARLAYVHVSKAAMRELEEVPRPLGETRGPSSPAERDLDHARLVRAYYRRVGERLARRFPEAFEAVVARVAALEDAEAARALFARYGRPLHGGRWDADGARLGFHLRMLLDAPRVFGRTDAERERIEGLTAPLLRHLLTARFGLEPAQVERVLALEDPAARRRALEPLLREHGVRLGREHGRERGRERGRGRRRR